MNMVLSRAEKPKSRAHRSKPQATRRGAVFRGFSRSPGRRHGRSCRVRAAVRDGPAGSPADGAACYPGPANRETAMASSPESNPEPHAASIPDARRVDFATYRPRHFRWALAGKVATVTLDRPDRKNPLTFESYAELRDTFRALALDGVVKTVLLTGSGGNFC